jgi:hypothetical protein
MSLARSARKPVGRGRLTRQRREKGKKGGTAMNPGETNAAFTIGYLVVILLILLAFIWAWRRTHGELPERREPGDDTSPPHDEPMRHDESE